MTYAKQFGEGPQAEETYVEPPEWRAADFVQGRAYRIALRIILNVGLRPGVQHWLHRDGAGHWWALEDRAEAVGSLPAEEDSGRAVDPLTADVHRLSLDDRASLDDLPLDLLKFLGGPDGAFAWAMIVFGEGYRLAGVRAAAASQLSALTNLPEWEALRAAAVRAGPNALLAINQLEAIAEGGAGPTVADELLTHAFDLGLGAGWLEASQALQRHEGSRIQSSEKSALRAEIWEAILEEADRVATLGEELKPYDLAARLVKERGTTERGRKLAEHGLPAHSDRVGRLIVDELNRRGIKV